MFNNLVDLSQDGWIVPGAGEPIASLIPSKVPLGEGYNEVLDAGKRYSRTHVIRHQQALGRKVRVLSTSLLSSESRLC